MMVCLQGQLSIRAPREDTQGFQMLKDLIGRMAQTEGGQMSREQFIKSHGATCRNWNWSWSFINETDKTIIFGAWDHMTKGDRCLIFSESWRTNGEGRKKPGYKQSREHIRLIEEEGYRLRTFPLIHSDANKDENGVGPAKIGGFVPELATKSLKREGIDWYAIKEIQSS